MHDMEKTIKGLEKMLSNYDALDEIEINKWNQMLLMHRAIAKSALELLKEHEAKPLRCKECSYHRDDGWCNEHRREVKESDYCSFGAWEGR